ncbi:MAG: UDP-N-acetylmuramoyl-L-alanine--D-glutamate ligase [Candidatus Krumholzibacteria bacterium]|nr:UDP-N-acetylmuramoyl-L-alanine--D-glutamate ligase [Candidatus Krumholzibacteria bacterium]
MNISKKKSFLVLGMGKSGIAVARLLADKGFSVVVFDDDRSAMDVASSMPEITGIRDSIEFASGESVLRHLVQSDCLVVSPGVPLDHPLVKKAELDGIELTGELEVAYHFCSSNLVGVTGTNGKSTVVGLLGSIFTAAGKRCVVAGNIGTPLSSVVDSKEQFDIIVLEISSFQLDTISDFKVGVAVLLNVTADHLDRYDNSFERYSQSKSRILNRADENTFFVYNAEDAVCRRIAAGFRGKKIPFSSAKRLSCGVYLDDDAIVERWQGHASSILATKDFSPVGVHNLENAMAAVAAAKPFSISGDIIRGALKRYHSLPHRMEMTRIVRGVAYINDSKATNVDAAIKSVRSIEGSLVLIMGGLDKNGDFTPLVDHIGGVKLVVVIGQASDKIVSVLNGHCEIQRADSMEAAVKIASEHTTAGDTVLLAPACASFDMFRDYMARGEAFTGAVNSL